MLPTFFDVFFLPQHVGAYSKPRQYVGQHIDQQCWFKCWPPCGTVCEGLIIVFVKLMKINLHLKKGTQSSIETHTFELIFEDCV